MASIERTAYPRFPLGRVLKTQELENTYTLTPNEQDYIKENVRGNTMRLNFAILLKSFQRLGYFPEIAAVPEVIIEHLKKCLDLPLTIKGGYAHLSGLYRHHERIRTYLGILPWRKIQNDEFRSLHKGQKLALEAAFEASQTMNNPADIINFVIEKLIHHRFELPAFSTLDNLVKRVRHRVNNKIFKEIFSCLSSEMIQSLEELLQTSEVSKRSPFNQLKGAPKSSSIKNFKELLNHHK